MTRTNAAVPYLGSPVEFIKALRSRNDPPAPQWPSKAAIALHGWADSSFTFVHKAEVVRDFVVDTWLRGEPENLTNGQLHALFAQVSPHCHAPSRLPVERLGAFEHAFASAKNDELGEATLATAADNIASIFGGRSDESSVGIDTWMNLWRGYLCLMQNSAAPEAGLSRLVQVCRTVLLDMLLAVATSSSDHAVTLKAIALINEHASASLRCKLPLAHTSDMIDRLYLSEATLFAQNPLGAHVASLLREVDTMNISSRYAFCLQLYRQTVINIQRRKYYLFVQPSSSQLPFESFANVSANSRILASTHAVLSFFDDTTTLCAASEHWSYRGELWGIVAELGCYVESSTEWQSVLRNDSNTVQDLLQGLIMKPALLDAPPATSLPLLNTLAKIAAIDFSNGQIRGQALAYNLCAQGCLQPDQLLGVYLHYSALTLTLPVFVNTVVQALDEVLPDHLAIPASQQESLFARCRGFGEAFERALAHLAPKFLEPSRFAAQLQSLIAIFQETFDRWHTSESLVGSKRKREEPGTSDTAALKLVVISYIERAFFAISSTPQRRMTPEVTEHLQVRVRYLYEYFTRWPRIGKKRQDEGGTSINTCHQLAAGAGLHLLRPGIPYFDSILLQSAFGSLITIMSDERVTKSLRAAIFDHLAATCCIEHDMEDADIRRFLETTLVLVSDQRHNGFDDLVWGRLADGLVLRVESSCRPSAIADWSDTIFQALCRARGSAQQGGNGRPAVLRCLRSSIMWECGHLRESLRTRALHALTSGENVLAGIACLNLFPMDSGLIQDDDILNAALEQICVFNEKLWHDWSWISWLSCQPKGRLLRLPTKLHSVIITHLFKVPDDQLGIVRSALEQCFALCFSRLFMPDSSDPCEQTVGPILSPSPALHVQTRLIACNALLMHLLEEGSQFRLPKPLIGPLIDCIYEIVDIVGAAHQANRSFDVDRLRALGNVRLYRGRFLTDYHTPASSEVDAKDMARLIRISDRVAADLKASAWSTGKERSSSAKVHMNAVDSALKTFSLAEQKRAIMACVEHRCHIRGSLLLLTSMLRHSADVSSFVLSIVSTLSQAWQTLLEHRADTLHMIRQMVLNKEVKLAAGGVQTIFTLLVRLISSEGDDALPIILDILRAFVKHRQQSLAHIRSEVLLLTKLALRALHTRLRDNSDLATNIARYLSDSFDRHHDQRAPVGLSRLAPALLVEWVRLEARHPLPKETSRCLRPGLLALCKRTAEMGNTREPSESGAPFGLGDVSGQVEREVWARLWHDWTRTRYAGQG